MTGEAVIENNIEIMEMEIAKKKKIRISEMAIKKDGIKK